jgi:hypothetical protein
MQRRWFNPGLFTNQIVVRVQVPIRKVGGDPAPEAPRVTSQRVLSTEHRHVPNNLESQGHHLLLPTPLQAFGVVSGWSSGDVEEGGGWRLVMLVRILFWISMWRGMADLGCILELTVLSILLLNVARTHCGIRVLLFHYHHPHHPHRALRPTVIKRY